MERERWKEAIDHLIFIFIALHSSVVWFISLIYIIKITYSSGNIVRIRQTYVKYVVISFYSTYAHRKYINWAINWSDTNSVIAGSRAWLWFIAEDCCKLQLHIVHRKSKQAVMAVTFFFKGNANTSLRLV